MRGITTWTPGEETFLSAWHQALAKMNPFLEDHPHPVVQEAHRRGVDIRELMLFHDCFIKERNPLNLFERELPEDIPWPWDDEGYKSRLNETWNWALKFYKVQNIEITQRVGSAEPEDY